MHNFLVAIKALVIVFCMASCSQKDSQGNQTNDSSGVKNDSIVFDAVLPDSDFQGDVHGDFNGDGIPERAFVRTTREGGPQSKSWIYTIEFDDESGIPPFSFETETEGYELINEGNLNDFTGDELSVRTQGTMMNRAYLQPYTFYVGAWGQAMETVAAQNVVYPQNLPDGLDSLSAQQLIFKEGNTVYYYKYVEPEDPTNGGEVLYQKAKAKLYTTITPLEHIYNEKTDIKGDFDGNGSYETAWIRILDSAPGSEDAGGYTLMSCVVEFSDRNIKPLTFSSMGEGVDFVSEGNLNKIPGADISISSGIGSSRYNGLSTYSYKFDGWLEVMNILVPRAMSADLDLDLNDIIFTENEEVYYYEPESIAQYDDTRDKSSLKKIKADIIWDY